MKIRVAVVLGLLLGGVARGAEAPLTVQDLTGAAHTPFETDGRMPTVLVFVSPYCPTANTYLPEIKRIADLYAGRARFALVQSDPTLKKADALKQAEMYGITLPVLLDPRQEVARRVGAKVTPEAVVFRRAGDVLYQGRINDLYINQTRKRPEPTTHDLMSALDAVLAGKPVSQPLTKAMGCLIPEPQ